MTFAVVVIIGEVDRMRVNGVDVVRSANCRMPDGSQMVSLRCTYSMVEEFDLRSSLGNIRGIGKDEGRIGKMVDGEDVDRVWVIRG